MPDQEKTTIIHTPCAFNVKGATRRLCEDMTSSSVRNRDGCCRIACTCRIRICRVCVNQGGDMGLVINPETGLCSFHKANGENARRPAPKLPTQVPDSLGRAFRSGNSESVVHTPRPKVVPNGERFPVVSASPPPVTRVPDGVAASLKKRADVERPSVPRAPRKRSTQRQSFRPWTGFKVRDPEAAGGAAFLMPLELSDRINLLRASDTIEEIATTLGIGIVAAIQFARLKYLAPDVRALLEATPERKPALRVSFAFDIARLKPDLQLSAAEKMISWEWSAATLKKYCADPANAETRKREVTRKASSTARPRKTKSTRLLLKRLRKASAALEQSSGQILEHAAELRAMGSTAEEVSDAELIRLRALAVNLSRGLRGLLREESAPEAGA